MSPKRGWSAPAGGGAAPDRPTPCQPPPPRDTPDPPEGHPTAHALTLGMQSARETRDDRGMNLDTVIEALRDARRALLFHDYEARVTAYYKVEDATAELSALLLATDPRGL